MIFAFNLRSTNHLQYMEVMHGDIMYYHTLSFNQNILLFMISLNSLANSSLVNWPYLALIKI